MPDCLRAGAAAVIAFDPSTHGPTTPPPGGHNEPRRLSQGCAVGLRALRSDDVQLHVDVAAGGVGVRADGVSLLHQRLRLLGVQLGQVASSSTAIANVVDSSFWKCTRAVTWASCRALRGRPRACTP